MTEKKRAPACAGTQTRAEKLTGDQIQSIYSSTDGQRSQGRIEALLPQGEQNAVRTSELVAMMGYASDRQLRAEIERERGHGALILSTVRGRGGYFRPADGEQGKEELQRFIATVSARAWHSIQVLRSAKRALAVLEGQEVLEDG